VTVERSEVIMGVAPGLAALGAKAPDFALEGTDGRTYRLADVRGGGATLVTFICNHCPYVQAVLDDIVRDAAELQSLGVGVIAIMPNDTKSYPADSFDNMKRLAEAKRFPFPYAIDRTQEVARAYGAVCTPDFFGFDGKGKLKYRGRLDEGRAGPVPAGARRELLEAMRAIAATGTAPTPQVPSMGCSIKWKAA
jgi:peroxiredoxin